MTTAATARIIKQVGKPNPPQTIALYGGSIGERKTAISDVQNDLYGAGLNVVDFNARRYLSENELTQPLIQQIVTELKSESETSGASADLVKRINESAPALISTQLASDDRIELIHQFDTAMKKLAAISIQKKPLVILIHSLERANAGAFINVSEFISDYLSINGFMFVISIGEDNLKNDLNSTNASIEAGDFLDDTFSLTVTFDEPVPQQSASINVEKPDDLFTPPQGLEVESGSDLVAKRKGTRVIPKPAGKASSKIFKVRELSGKKTVVKTGSKPKKRKIRKKNGIKSKKKVFRPSSRNSADQFIQPVLSGDIFAVKKLWEKASGLKYEEFTEIVNKIL
ncbi:MAG: P-loop NTPase fold protein, partial [Candidatus Poseidoniales archaeon]